MSGVLQNDREQGSKVWYWMLLDISHFYNRIHDAPWSGTVANSASRIIQIEPFSQLTIGRLNSRWAVSDVDETGMTVLTMPGPTSLGNWRVRIGHLLSHSLL